MPRVHGKGWTMNRFHWLTAMLALAGLALLTHAAGCIVPTDLDDCDVYPHAGCTGGTGGGTPAGCNPTTSTSPVADSCGVFVSSSKGSDASGTGTKEAPYQTLPKALGAAAGMPVYACGETFTVTQTVTLSAKVDLYGALDCAQGWAYDATTKTQLQADTTATPIPMTLSMGASGSSVHDFAITAADATMTGGSSIAVLDDQAALTLENVDIAAGAGMAGAAGAPQSQVTTPTSASGTNGADDASCNMTSNIPGGTGGTNICNGSATNGGNGGEGLPVAVGDPGASGQPTTPANGGAGQTSTPCQTGGSGNEVTAGEAADGMPGTGAHGIGDVSASGYQPPAAMLGTAGSAGQGGGGGGGAHACDANNMFAGPSGGGGGAGGCGGAAGNFGTSGGSSIGILALGAKLTLTTVTITTKAGGIGGAGASGQPGENGGVPGSPGAAGACPGGSGGQGGAGGPGGGGAGGHSVGIAVKNGTLPTLGTTTITPGNGGMGGAGGDTTTQTQGDPGLGCKTLDFTNPAMTPPACVM
jgi:hypothetical protein